MNLKILDEITRNDFNTMTRKNWLISCRGGQREKSQGVIFGLSGGIDSAVIAMLCAKFVREKSLALIMPDSKITPVTDTEDAIKIVDSSHLEYKLIDIGFIHKEYSKYIEPSPLAFGNLGARIRSNILYYYANARNYLVLGSGDRSEFLIGYFTKYGDGAADLLPISSLYKTQIREFAKFLGVPSSIVSKPSGPRLWEGHTAEAEIGLTYEEIDSILYCIVDKNLSIEDTSKITEIPISNVDKIYQMHKRSEHKRITPKACVL
ncbi:NAD synthetase [Candidatus Nitrosotalea sp. TS]|uniref:NAD+ synthase n=1 Tax=Candidatus Nitrosotalea sp. TS TaxID=2341020 RepID=UPI00140A7BD3|nr:NAD+ synthase [Candidatus Nitrosotalea sp. TS]NHI02458.1 NAD synthetase [Candidatus Nitrosotalea sp. TS]